MGSIVQAKDNIVVDAGGTTVASGSFGSNVTAGNFLQIFCISNPATTVSVTQNSGTATLGTITEQSSVTEAALGLETTLLTCSITGTGSLDLLLTLGTSCTSRGIAAWEISGVSGYQGSDHKTDAGSNPTPNPALTFNVTTQPAFAVATGSFFQGGTPGVGTGFTDYATFWGGSSRAQYKAVTATGNTTGNFVNAAIDRANSAMVVWTDGGGASPALDDSGTFPGFEAQSNPLVISMW